MTDVASADREPDDFQLGRTLASLLATEHQIGQLDRVVIAIAGESGSGKSLTAIGLARALEAGGAAVTVLHQDDYFHRPPRANHEHRILDLGSVGPQEVNLELMRTHIAAFRAGANDVTVPRVDYPGDRFLSRQLDFSASRTLIVEGTYVLHLDGSDVRIFLEASSDDTRERRRIRNRDIDAPIIDQVLAIEHQLIAPQAALAHIVIDRDFRIRRRSDPG